MPNIRPVSDLRNHFAEISAEVHETNLPLYLTKNGHGDMVIMSLAAYEDRKFESEIHFKLQEAELEATSTTKRFSHKEVFSSLRKQIAKYA
ncbi:antitoxin Phd-YefM [Candidatus Termititenax dinenymphae]|uniref:Antitoxin n=1 Tax=Candidatus Termititenax dinenymphae TaxID=2218523 RepID=A0A388TKR0_9BACT|nr:antitoxin Phd-YefM [Candidatus Termititenax dinenymphae]